MYWIIFIGVFIASVLIQSTLKSKFEKYSKVPAPAGMTGEEVALKMLADHGITDVTVQHVSGQLTDHYDPRNKTLNLSDNVFGNCSIAAAAVAAHECGHAVQHQEAYGPLTLRSALVPVVSFANNWVMWVLLAGMIFINTFPTLIWIGIGLFACTTLFSFVTLPVEVNASQRAVDWLSRNGIVDYETRTMASDALHWAAYTYVVAALGSLATLLYYISIAERR